jgi:hypothetical protein
VRKVEDGSTGDGANDGAAVLGIGVGALLGENRGDGSDKLSPVAELQTKLLERLSGNTEEKDCTDITRQNKISRGPKNNHYCHQMISYMIKLEK